MTKKKYLHLDNSPASFQLIKLESEKLWKTIDLEDCWGFQIQEGSKWNKGLSEEQLKDFQNQMNLEFPKSLKNFYRTMNGLNKPSVNNNGGEGTLEYGSLFYSYPEDIKIIKSQIEWVLEANKITQDEFKTQNFPPIFPYFGHRFLIFDHPENALSMYGDDIIFWADNLSKGIAKDIFSLYSIEDNIDLIN
ncbi:MAG: SMI1/KNR4 family protein [Chryseobacterium sp.]|nr:SMI1/KNR4 family protein [Candidatus Chryseobacterium enterohippi]